MPISKVLFLGPIAYYTGGRAKDQMGKLVLNLKDKGFNTRSRSNYNNKILRLLGMISFMTLNSRKYEAVFIQSFGFLSFFFEDITSFLARKFRKKILFTIRGGAFMDFYAKHPKWVERVFKRADLLTSPSLFLKEKLDEIGFEINHIPNFIDIDRFPYKRDCVESHSILWVRAFEEIYNPELAIETLYEIKKKYPAAKMTMVGPDKGLLRKCLELIVKLGLNDCIDIKGYIPNNELPVIYQQHHVFLTTTRFESFGVAIFEAAASGIPNVSVCVGEIPYIWKDNHDALLSERSAKKLAAKIEMIFTDQEFENMISLNARRKAEEYQWEKIWPKWKNIIETL